MGVTLTQQTVNIIVWSAVILTVIGLLTSIMMLIAACIVFNVTMRRKKKTKWGRGPSRKGKDYLRMFEQGQEWYRQNCGHKTDVHIVNNGLNLYGEYYDFGSDRCVMIMGGRTEGLCYGYYYAQPYVKAGNNVLIVDSRAHGLSDGEFNTAGFEESKDAIAWARHIHDNFGIKSIIFHGICIGAAVGMHAITSDDCPDYVDGIVTDGMYANFGKTMKEHLVEFRQPTFILYEMIDLWMIYYTGHTMRVGPIDVIPKLKKPLLMIHSKEDIYSRAKLAQELYDQAGTENKELVWFEHGKHSMLRIADTEKYDAAISKFLETNFNHSVSA